MTRAQRRQFVIACIVEAFGYTMRENGEFTPVCIMGGRVESAGIHMRESLPKPDRVDSEYILAMHRRLIRCAGDAGDMTFPQYAATVMAIVAEYRESLPDTASALREVWGEVEGLVWEAYQLFDPRGKDGYSLDFGDTLRRDIMRAMV